MSAALREPASEAVRGVCDEYIELQARLQRYGSIPNLSTTFAFKRRGQLVGVVGRRYMHIGQLRLTQKAIRKIGMNSRHDVRRHADGFKAAMQAEDKPAPIAPQPAAM